MMLGDERGPGALLTTAADLLRWNAGLADTRLGSFVTEKLQEPARLNNGRELSYGRAHGAVTAPGRLRRHIRGQPSSSGPSEPVGGETTADTGPESERGARPLEVRDLPRHLGPAGVRRQPRRLPGSRRRPSHSAPDAYPGSGGRVAAESRFEPRGKTSGSRRPRAGRQRANRLGEPVARTIGAGWDWTVLRALHMVATLGVSSLHGSGASMARLLCWVRGKAVPLGIHLPAPPPDRLPAKCRLQPPWAPGVARPAHSRDASSLSE